MSKAVTDPLIRENKLEESGLKISKLERQIGSRSIVKKYPSKRKTYWCAPRKVKGIESVENIEDTVKTEKSKKKRQKKGRKVGKRLRRIDILAQPKSVKLQSNQKYCSIKKTEPSRPPKIVNASYGKRRNTTYPHKSLKTNKTKTGNNLLNSFTAKSKLQGSSAIVLPRKVGLRLFSLVTKKLKELTNTKNV
ncbi:uncharacterized protein LOC143177294 [Calliopsis andreniformis]|uniref:uncharacterized protein LOC143177294 n=1 Tax=Calliopsis andreniformis TaxID=337506 RepID=UPI003FCC3552